ncbi:MarR family transcriptional regulator [Streptomyces sp. NPDC087897]|uniref:MarR family transcriptional regulator n=1 Tax=Streptomyces sp. NPDC087897 TaxID=3365817 RepID=UPI00382D16F4
MAKPGYGKRSAPDQNPRTRDDFALLPTRERYVAGFIDHLPEGAAMSVKQLAKHLPLYGQQAVSTALNALSVAGHLRRVLCRLGTGYEVRWIYRTFWSRTARDNEWWTTYLATETAVQALTPAAAGPEAPRSDASPQPNDATAVCAPEPAAVPQQRTPPPAPEAPQPQPEPRPTEQWPSARDMVSYSPIAPAPASPVTGAVRAALRVTAEPECSPAYLALAHLGRTDHRLALSANDCTALEPLATAWLTRGVSIDYLTSALTAGLPAQIDSPAGLLRRRLTDKIPPQLPTTEATPFSSDVSATDRRILIECTNCGRPGPPEAVPDGLCRPCHQAHTGNDTTTPSPAEIATVKAHMANLRSLLKPV